MSQVLLFLNYLENFHLTFSFDCLMAPFLFVCPFYKLNLIKIKKLEIIKKKKEKLMKTLKHIKIYYLILFFTYFYIIYSHSLTILIQNGKQHKQKSKKVNADVYRDNITLRSTYIYASIDYYYAICILYLISKCALLLKAQTFFFLVFNKHKKMNLIK